MFLGFSKGFGVDDHLMLSVHRRYAIITLDHSMGTFHLSAIVVGQVALSRPGLSPLLFVSLYPVLKLLYFRPKRLYLFLLSLYHRVAPSRQVPLPVLADHIPNRPLRLCLLFL